MTAMLDGAEVVTGLDHERREFILRHLVESFRSLDRAGGMRSVHEARFWSYMDEGRELYGPAFVREARARLGRNRYGARRD